MGGGVVARASPGWTSQPDTCPWDVYVCELPAADLGLGLREFRARCLRDRDGAEGLSGAPLPPPPHCQVGSSPEEKAEAGSMWNTDSLPESARASGPSRAAAQQPEFLSATGSHDDGRLWPGGVAGIPAGGLEPALAGRGGWASRRAGGLQRCVVPCHLGPAMPRHGGAAGQRQRERGTLGASWGADGGAPAWCWAQ